MALAQASGRFGAGGRCIGIKQLLRCAAVMAILLPAAGCNADNTIVITDFSKPVHLAAALDPGAKVWGLSLDIRAMTTEPVKLRIGSAATAHHDLVIPPGGSYRGKVDWYANTADISFEQQPGAAGRVTISYRFLLVG